MITRRRRTALFGFCPDLLCGVCQSKSEIFSREVFECPDFELELDFDRQTPHSNSGQNPNSAVHRRLTAKQLANDVDTLNLTHTILKNS